MTTDYMDKASRAFQVLRNLTHKQGRNVERCELCRCDLHDGHPHLIEVARRKMVCACEACAMLFSGREIAKYRRISRQARLLPNFQMTDAEWDALMIPINLAYFFSNSLEHRVSAFYPSPAGATESLLPLSAWNQILEANPHLKSLEPDVEALLVNRVGQARADVPAEYYIVPIDACYTLVGLIRLHWKGFSGGTEVWQEIGAFFAKLRAQALVVDEGAHA